LTNNRVERRLAAILAADVAGYSRLTGLDEEGTHVRLRECLRGLADPKISEHRGKIVKHTGDGVLAEFGSVVDAVRCAIEVQRGMAEQNATMPQVKRIEFRIGIHVGDIIVDDNDIFGDGVNIAARLEGIAEPGGVCISDDAQRQIRGKVDTDFEDMGPQNLKNIAEPMRAWRLRMNASGSATVPIESSVESTQALALPDKPSIAVLPFENLSGDPEQEYFADGMVEDIITALSRFKSLFVIARNSSFTYKGKAVDIRHVGRDLGVRYVLEGSVRKAGSRLRITGQLIDTNTGSHIWAERYDGELGEIFDLQDKITSNVAGAIEPKVRDAEVRRAQAKATTNLTARDLYMRAVAAFIELTEASYAEALLLLDRAVAADPRFSSAYGLITWCQLNKLGQGWGDPSERKMRALAATALALQTGKDDSYALSAAGMAIARFGTQFEEGLARVERALALNTNDVMAWHAGGWTSWCAGKHERSIESFKQAMRLSPIDPASFGRYAGIAFPYFFTGKYDEAIRWADKALNDEPRFLPAHSVKVAAAAMAGQNEVLKEATQRLIAARPGFSISQNGYATLPSSLWDPFQSALRKAGLPE
jgi:adenylate cyclase